MPTLYKNFTAEQLEEQMKATPVRHAVFVQVLINKPEETSWFYEYFKRFLAHMNETRFKFTRYTQM